MKIKITRSFERTRQIADFVPVKAFCEASIDATEVDGKVGETGEDMAHRLSARLDAFVQSEVEKTLMNYYPVCIVCGAKGVTVNLNKEGVCGECVKNLNYRMNDLKKETVNNGTKGRNQKS